MYGLYESNFIILTLLLGITITTPIGGRNFGSYPSPSSSSLLLPPSDAKNKEVTDERMEGNLADIQASLQTAAEEMDTARAAEVCWCRVI